MSCEQNFDLSTWQKCSDRSLQACSVLGDLKSANFGIVAAVVLVVRVVRHFDQLVAQATMHQSAHVWQTSGYVSHSPDIAIPVVCNWYKLEWLRRI